MKSIIFDIDGTLADIAHRRVFLDQERPDWKAFNDKIGEDSPHHVIVELYKTLWNSKQYDMILVSGRGEDQRKVTEQWLTWNEIPFEILEMRREGDSRSDYLVKEEILKKLQAQGKNILFVVDDRQQVVDMWRRNGIVCLQCDVGNF